MDINKTEIGKRIFTIRKSLGLTMKEFGERMGNPVASDSIVSRWEKGVSVPNNERLKRIAEIGDISVNELLYGDSQEYVHNVLIEELNNHNKLYSVLKEHYIEDTNEDEIHLQAVKLINDSLEQIYTRLRILTTNQNINSSNESLSIYQLNKERIISIAISYFEPKKEYTFEEYYKEIKSSLEKLPYYSTKKSLKQLTNQFLKTGYSEEEAHKIALDKFYMSEATNPLNDFNEALDNLYNEYRENN